ncbi:uncharacterized protein LOC133923977 [Phragmites australis]|uniref:uncharacterized protein LOC133923977 n=1 Tax=Phragmites australis TaxID=29695 RepID=UPI002D7964CD|nr:uncharacterized protein LOC133923977 [Phragmites australis]XP_062225296.1 uncharacterized protein LOC133923977 [Phragmites australis]
MEDDEKPHLPMDIISKIPTHISDPASLVRAASSYKLWRNLIKDSTFLDGLKRRHGDHGFTSSLLLGFFYQESSEAPSHLWQHHMDKNRCLAPSFIPTSELLQFSGSKEGCNAVSPMSLGTFIPGIGASLNFYEPVASQDSFLALCRRSQGTDGRARPDVLCVCNPLTGEVFHIPNLQDMPPHHYALLVTDDVGLDGRMSQSFRLVSIWIKGKKFIYVYYCSKTRAWWRPTSAPELMPGLYLMPTLAAPSHGGIHWLCGSWKSLTPTHICTLHVDEEELSYVELPPEAKSNKVLLLANSADRGILLLLVKGLQMSLWKHKLESGDASNNWVLSEMIDMTSSLPMRFLMMQPRPKFRLEIFRGKSGAVVIWIEGEGLFLFCLSDRSMRKIDNENVTKRYCVCPYEMDWLSCLAVTNLVVDGSLDGARTKVHGRWRTLMANNTLP